MNINYLNKTGLIRFKDKIVTYITNAISGKEDKSNKVTEINENSTNTQYPGAKAVHDKFANLGTTKTASGTSIDITDSVEGNMSLNIKGNTEQDSYTGKNSFDKDNTTTTAGYFSADGTINYGGSSTITTSYISIKPNTDMVISGFNLERVCFYDENKNFIERIIPSSAEYTFNKNAYYIRIQAATSVFNLDILQLEEGTTATDFEPFVRTESQVQIQNIHKK